MQLGEISFCDRIGFNIKSDDAKKKILDDVERFSGMKIIQKHHERFRPDMLSKINNMPHLVSLRTNGNPYFMYLTKCNFVNQVIFIDKKVQHGYFYPRMILSKLWFDEGLFDNTLLEGEMIKTNTGEWHFVLNDIICMNGVILEKANLIRRIQMLYDIVAHKYKNDEMNCCQVVVKRYFRVTQIRDMTEDFMPSLPYSCRGIYFKPFYLKFKDILYNFDDALVKKVTRIKLKHECDSTFLLNSGNDADVNTHSHGTQQENDSVPVAVAVTEPATETLTNNVIGRRTFYAKKTSNPDIYELYTDAHSSNVCGTALVNDIKTSKLMREAFRLCNVSDRLAFICEHNYKFNKWRPVEPVGAVAASGLHVNP